MADPTTFTYAPAKAQGEDDVEMLKARLQAAQWEASEAENMLANARHLGCSPAVAEKLAEISRRLLVIETQLIRIKLDKEKGY